jgi:hypothetical protein
MSGQEYMDLIKAEYSELVKGDLTKENSDKFAKIFAILVEGKNPTFVNFSMDRLFSIDNILGKKIRLTDEKDITKYVTQIFEILNKYGYKFKCNQFKTFFFNNSEFYCMLSEKADHFLTNLEENILGDYECLNKLLSEAKSYLINFNAIVCYVKKNKKSSKDKNLQKTLQIFLENLRSYKSPDNRSILSDVDVTYTIYKLLDGGGENDKLSMPEIRESMLTSAIKMSLPLDDIVKIANATKDKSFKTYLDVDTVADALIIFLNNLKFYQIDGKSVMNEPTKVYNLYKLLGGKGNDGKFVETNKTILMYAVDAQIPIEELRKLVLNYRDLVPYKDNLKLTVVDYFKRSYRSDVAKMYDIFPRTSIDQTQYNPTEYNDEIRDINLIAGISSFYIYRNKEKGMEDQIIYLFGEIHTESENIDCGSLLLKGEMHYVVKVLKNIFKHSKKGDIIDYFEENDTYLRYIGEKRKYKLSEGGDENIPTISGTSNNIHTEFKECFLRSIENDKKCRENYGNIRFHFADIRQEFKYMMFDKLYELYKDQDILFYLEILFMACSIEKRDEKFTHLIKKIEERRKAGTFDIDKLCDVLFIIPKIKKQLDASYYQKQIKQYIKNKMVQMFENNTNYSMIGALVMDTYLLSRIFRTYEEKGESDEIYQKKSNKIIIYAGHQHIANYVGFLKSSNFTEIYAKSNIEFTDPPINTKWVLSKNQDMSNQCVDITDMQNKKYLLSMEMRGGAEYYKTYMKNKTLYRTMDIN